MWDWEAEEAGLINPYVTLKAARGGYTSKYLATERRGNNRLTLGKLQYPELRLDGKMVSFDIIYTWYSDDKNTSVLGKERTLWSLKELKETGLFKGKPLMDCFNLCG